MSKIFIFSKDVEDALREGRKEIVVSQGARISAAAQDLLRRHGIQITLQQDRFLEGGEGGERQPEEAKEESRESAGLEKDPDPVSEEDLERIVDRVIQRFREEKGTRPGLSESAESEAVGEDDGLVLCRCEEITKGEIREAIRAGMRTLNGIKRVTRAGMGLCQGQTCERLVAQILSQELRVPASEVEPATARAPVRPVRLSVFATG